MYYPVFASLLASGTPSAPFPGTFSLEMMPQVPTIDPVRHSVRDLWVCPSAAGCQGALDQTNNDFYWGWGMVRTGYGYWGRTDLWNPPLIPNQTDLTGRELVAERLLMNDGIRYWWGNTGWGFNHGRFGASFDYNYPAVWVGPPPLSGNTDLMGDGHVTWRPGVDFSPTLMNSLTWGEGSRFVRIAGLDGVFY